MHKFRQKRPHWQRGYTLAEMMVVITVIGILAAIAVPGMTGYLRRARMMGIRDQMIADVYYARSLAITNRRTIRITFTPTLYTILDTTNGAVVRRISAPRGVTFAATANPNFYAWGLADAATLTVTGANLNRQISVMPTGAVDYQ
ncbi:MAG TPA: GspH/FimT family pseudopilin [Candidatus Krumholzibacteria bacterium]|nr:GspH/FimT family pseudopilin [Candidatus Krumholzibacteria bacterium]